MTTISDVMNEIGLWMLKQSNMSNVHTVLAAYGETQTAAEAERCAVICDNCHTTQGAAERIRARGNP